MARKIAVIGAGHVGSEAARELIARDVGEVVLVDIVEGMPQGKALDMSQARPILGGSFFAVGTNDYDMVKGADAVIITAGVARKPGMSREDLLKTNLKIISSVVREVKRVAPDAFLVMVTNPLDAMVYTAYRLFGAPRERVMGMAGMLDSTRFATFIAMELGVSPADVRALVLGTHGDLMVPVMRYASVAGIPVTELIPRERLEAIVERTRKGGGEIVKLLKTGSAYFAPGTAAALMVDAILNDKKRVVPTSVYLQGEYGISDVFVGVPVVLGARGVERVLELPLAEDEMAALRASAEHVKALQKEVDAFLSAEGLI